MGVRMRHELNQGNSVFQSNLLLIDIAAQRPNRQPHRHRRPVGRRIGRVDIAGDGEPADIAALRDEEKDGAVTGPGETAERLEMAAAAASYRIGKGGEVAVAPPGHVLDLDEGVGTAARGDMEVEPGAVDDARFGADRSRKREAVDAARLDGLGDEAVGVHRVEADERAFLLDDLEPMRQLAPRIAGTRQPHRRPLGEKAGKPAGVGAMGGDRGPFGERHIGEETLVAADQPGFDEWSGEPHRGYSPGRGRVPQGKRGTMEERSSRITACLIIIGNEILSGRTVDANLPHLATTLGELGITLAEARIVPDIEEEIVDAVNATRKKHDYVFTTGGIGPTHDDITAAAIARAFNVKLIRHPEAERRLLAYYPPERVTEARLKMANTPEGVTLIDNPVSVAPGFQIENVFVLAGVPKIMQAMLDVLKPQLRGGAVVASRTLVVFRGEGDMAQELQSIQTRYPEVEIGSYPFFRLDRAGTSIVFRSADPAKLDAAFTELARHCADNAIEAHEERTSR